MQIFSPHYYFQFAQIALKFFIIYVFVKYLFPQSSANLNTKLTAPVEEEKLLI